MSGDCYARGRLKKINTDLESTLGLENLKKYAISKIGISDWERWFAEDWNTPDFDFDYMFGEIPNHVLINGELYEQIEHEENESNYFCELTHNNDGTISYYVGYYNGSQCLQEVIEDKLNEQNNEFK